MRKIGSASTQALTSSKETSPGCIRDRIHFYLEVFETGNFEAMSQLLWAKYLQESTAPMLHSGVCAVASKRFTDHQFTHPPPLFEIKFPNKSEQKEYRSWWKRKIGLEFAIFKLAQSTSRLHQILFFPNPALNVKTLTLDRINWR